MRTATPYRARAPSWNAGILGQPSNRVLQVVGGGYPTNSYWMEAPWHSAQSHPTLSLANRRDNP
jgi:hypothetical protein